MSKPPLPQRWDIFCNVIDNFGDIGVAWRLARSLAQDYAFQVRLWVDDLASFAVLCPALNPQLAQQSIAGVAVCHWPGQHFPAAFTPGEVVIEAFGCTLPDSVLQAMSQMARAPYWINLEYLTAEDWIEDCHGLPSPHPQWPLTKYFYFPGFSATSGGLICEPTLNTQRLAWQQDTLAQQALWQQYGLPPTEPDGLRISLFSYENAACASLLKAWAEGDVPISCVVPTGRIQPQLEAFFGQKLKLGQPLQQDALQVVLIPMSEQPQYDRLLWSCDLNWVRGEDSWVRAQWAGRPLLWQAYPQAQAAHLTKLQAFLTRYTAGLPDDLTQAITQCHLAWNQEQDMRAAWQNLLPRLADWSRYSTGWSAQLQQPGSLVDRLLHFIQKIS